MAQKPAKSPEEEKATQAWAALLNAAIERRAQQAQRPVDAVENAIAFQLRGKGITGDMFREWVKGESYPKNDPHEHLLAILFKNYSANAEQCEAMRAARISIIRANNKTPAKKPTPRPARHTSGGSYVHRREDKEPAILRKLRVDQTNTPYEEMTAEQRDRILKTIRERIAAGKGASAAEYILCYRLNKFGAEVKPAAERMGIHHTTLKKWETGQYLPESSLLKDVRPCLGERDYKDCEHLVISNRLLLMLEAIPKEGDTVLTGSNYYSFGTHIKYMPQDFFVDELKRFYAGAESIIFSKGLYYQCLRRAAALESSDIADGAGIAEATLNNIETDQRHTSASAPSRKRLENYLEGQLNALYPEMAELQSTARKRINDLPGERPRGAAEDAEKSQRGR